ncbi:hypothetical protein [Ignatzschineria sp. LJL83]
MKIIKASFCLRLSVLLVSMMGMSMANNTQTPVHYQMNFSANNMGCKAKLNGMYLIHTMDLMKGVPKSVSLTQSIGNFVDENLNTLTLEVHNLSNLVTDPQNGYCDIDITAKVQNPDTGSIDSKEVSHIRYTYVQDDADIAQNRWLLSKKESRVDQDEDLANLLIQVESLESYILKDKKELQREFVTREFTVHHSQPFSWIHQSTPFEDTPENKQKLWEKYQEIKRALAGKSRRDIRKLVEPGNTDIAQHQGEDPEQHFAIIFEQLIQPYFDLKRDIWSPVSDLGIDDFDLEIYADGKLFRLNEKRKTLYSPIQWKNLYQRLYRTYNPIFTLIDGEIVMATF